MGKVVKADSRGRISLTRQLAGPPHALYLLEEFPDGTLVLTPARALSQAELAALQDPVVRDAVRQARPAQ